MKLFNDVNNGFEELLNMYPSFYREVYEMIEILKAQGNISDMLKKDMQQVFFNQFIDTADSKTISAFEKILKLNNSSKTLDERRRIVKACLISSGKLSASKITDIIEMYTGAKVEITFETESYNADYDTLVINAERGSGNIIDVSDVMKLISNKIPAHIFYDVMWFFDFSVAVESFFEIYNPYVPACGQYMCGQDILF